MQVVANFADTKGYEELKNDWNPGTWVLIWILGEHFRMNTSMTGFSFQKC